MDELTEVERKVSHEREAPKPSSRPTASAATHELDMLMADLSDFKLPPEAQVSKPPPPPKVRMGMRIWRYGNGMSYVNENMEYGNESW